MKHFYLIDGSGFIFRAFHGLPMMTRPDGTPVNAVYGFTTMLLKLIDDMDADHLAVIFDTKRLNFRNDIYPEYKANRSDPPEELIPQFGLIREATRAFNVPVVEKEGFEADDLIATYAKLAAADGARVTIVSSDKDLMQLVNDQVDMLDAMKNRTIREPEVLEKFGVGPDKVVDVQSLAGDSTDNVPGVPGIGIKTAAQLINDYGDLDTLLERAEEIKQPKRRQNLLEHAEMARISRQLVRLRDDVEVEATLDSFAVQDPDPETVMAFLKEQSFKSLIKKMESRFGSSADGGEPAEPEAPAEKVYELVRTEEALAAWIAEAKAKGTVAFDCETTDLRPMWAELVGVSLCIEPGRACYVPLAHKGGKPQTDLFGADEGAGAGLLDDQIPMGRALAMLKDLLEDDSVLKVGQNIKYDAEVFQRLGINVAPCDDTMLLSFVLDGGAGSHNMDDLADRHLGLQTIKFKEVAGTGKAQVTFDYVSLDKALDYAAEDADITLRLHRLLKPRLAREHMVTVYERIERPLIPIIRDMEAAGIKVDAAELKALSDDFAKRGADLETECHRLAGREFKVSSPKQLGEILFDEMSLAGGKKGKTGAYKTDAEVLETLAAEGHDLPAKVLEWRQLAKLKSTYTDALLGEINAETGRVHTSFSMVGAATGRLSSSDPNLQNIPIRTEEGRKIRRAFIAEPGHKLISADYSQIELRLLAHVAEISSLRQAFIDGQDIHAMTASEMFGVPIEGMDPMIRRRAKAINFGIIYGISAFGLSRQLSIPRGEASDYIKAYFERYPGIRAYMDSTKKQAKEQGFVETLFGRKVHLRGITDKNPNMVAFAERAAINAPIQGGAADIIKRAMIRLPGRLAEAGLAAKMLLQVHDELIFEVPEGEVEATRSLVSTVMEEAASLTVPLVAEAGVGDNWGEAH
ncbi:MAG: DNA polymerase I [Magnetovibrionaceae bacterium]